MPDNGKVLKQLLMSVSSDARPACNQNAHRQAQPLQYYSNELDCVLQTGIGFIFHGFRCVAKPEPVTGRPTSAE